MEIIMAKPGPKRKKRPPCLNCGKEIKKNASSFCSRACDAEYRWKEKIKHIVETNGTGSGIGIRTLKRYLIQVHGHVCSICGLKEWMGKEIPLVMDHIDGRALNNSLENLRLVCANCDSQLPTFKSKNKNSDRKRK